MQKRQKINDQLMFINSVVALIALIIDYGYPDHFWSHLLTDFFYLFFGGIFTLNLFDLIREGQSKGNFRASSLYFIFGLSISLVFLGSLNAYNYLWNQSSGLNLYVAILVFLLTLFDLSARVYEIERQTLHPALVFAFSFLFLICIGTLLLMLPRATVDDIGFVDALFTSTSAVCVTGLTILDTGKEFTRFGQIIILLLIQFGALGMLTFTNLFGLLFKGSGSFKNRLYLKNLINANTLGSTFNTLVQIIVFTIIIESLGALLIYVHLDHDFSSATEKIFFSVFHAISAFANAGFSTLSNSLYESGFRHDYDLHMVIALLIIIGGLGYGVVLNYYQYFRKFIVYWFKRFTKIQGIRQKLVKPNLSANTRIVVLTTSILLVLGWAFFYVLEYDNTLEEHSDWGKVLTAFFGSVTTRTAGFNTVDTGALALPTLVIVTFLMWIGASPGSTGGGIKTTTMAIASMNIYQQAFGYNYIKFGWKKIKPKALQRANAIISLSLIMIGISIFCLVIFDEHLGILPIAFECFSAFSTVGLSMGITADLSIPSKLVITLTMFIGRVGFLTLITGMVRQFVKYRYKPINYPEEEIFIN